MTEHSQVPTDPSNEFFQLIRRVCEQLAIAYSENEVIQDFADVAQTDAELYSADTLTASCRSLGIRFRELNGTFSDLINSVNDSGPALVNPRHPTAEDKRPILVLSMRSRGRLLIWSDGVEKTVSTAWLRRNIERGENRRFDWLLIQPLLAAENISRFNYHGGDTGRPITPLRRWLALLKPEAKDVRTIIVFSAVIGLLSLTTPLAVEAVVNTIAFGRYLQPLVVLSLIVLVFLGFRAFLNVLMHVVTEIIQRKLFVRTVEDLSYRLVRVPLEKWKSAFGPELVNRFFDVVNIQKVTSKLLLETLMLLLQTVIGLAVLAFYHPFLLGYDIALLLMMTVVLWLIGRGAVKTAKEESQLKYETAAWLQEIVRHPSTFKFNGGLKFAINRADELAGKYIQNRQSHFKILIRQISFAMVIQVVAATVLLALGGYLVIEGELTLGQLVAAELIVTVILGSFAKLGKDLESFYDLMASVDKLGKLFDLPVEQANKLQLARKPGAYGISLVDVKIGNSPPASISFAPGQSYAIYSDNELDRAMLVESISGQAKPKKGYVLLNDFRVDAINAESLQAKIGFVKEIELFNGPIDENIRLGRQNISSDQVNNVISHLGLSETVSALANDLNTELQIGGYPLSNGQAIRLTLARALVVRPGVLIIDGLLDRLSDKDTADVLDHLNEFKKETTIIVSTGRRVIANWATKTLQVNGESWELSDFSN